MKACQLGLLGWSTADWGLQRHCHLLLRRRGVQIGVLAALVPAGWGAASFSLCPRALVSASCRGATPITGSQSHGLR